MFGAIASAKTMVVYILVLVIGCGSSSETESPRNSPESNTTMTAVDGGSPDSDVSDVGLSVDMAAADTGFVPPTELPMVDEEMESFLNDNTQLDGAAVIIVHRDYGVIHRRAYGAFDEDRIYFVASSSKMVAAGIINRLHDDGVFDMNAPSFEPAALLA